MNKTDFLKLFITKIYNFYFYYGEVKTGILVSLNRKYYIIESFNIAKYNNNSSDIEYLLAEHIIVEVNIGTIVKWEPIK